MTDDDVYEEVFEDFDKLGDGINEGTGLADEDVLYLMDRLKESMDEHHEGAKEDREEIYQRLDNIIERTEESEESQRIEELETKLEKHQKSIPYPTYVVIALGIAFAMYGIFVSDAVYILSGSGMVAIGVMAIVESRRFQQRSQ